MMTSNCSFTTCETVRCQARFRASVRLPIAVLDAVPTLGCEADDVVVGAADGAGTALHAVAKADDGLLLVLVPLVHSRGAEVVAVFARAPVPANVLVADLDVRVAGVLDVAIGEELVGELLHLGHEVYPGRAPRPS